MYRWNQPEREKAKKLGSLDHLYSVCFAGNCHVYEAYRGKSYFGI